MDIPPQIEAYISSQPEPKRSDMRGLHRFVLNLMPECRLWFLDGKNTNNKVVSNPNIGYGLRILQYADGKSREFYQIGLSANTTGLSIYIMGLKDKNYLASTYGKRLGKASVSGYCIKFKNTGDINLDILGDMLRYSINYAD